MKILPVTDPAFAPYGKVVDGYDFSFLIKVLNEQTPCPEDGVIYERSVPAMEALPVCKDLQDRFYGGMPIQLGCCNGVNARLNCLEYHRDSEVNVAADDIVLLVAKEDEIVDGILDTQKVKAFLLPAGCAAELYATTLHYAPCSARTGDPFRVVIVLPRGTNLQKPEITPASEEDRRLFAANKWLLAHPDAPEAKTGAYIGLTGKNIDLSVD